MSDTEEENYCFYGTPLDPYDEDTFPKRKPIGIEEQVATDAQGRRRFHGAFTGGFSAGFFNTVGTPEGWTPSEFKSSRSEKASSKFQKPQDFMDDEDMGEFGIAPQTVKATDDFSTKKKRKKQPFSTGPIPGIPVLHTLLEIHTETIGYTLMKNMGWKVAGEASDEEENAEDVPDGDKKVYGCVIPKAFRLVNCEKFTIQASALESKHPYEVFLKNPKDNSFGMGYSGLDRSIFGHVNLLEPSKLTIREKKSSSRRSTIRGQAFGVGAFEQEDEDIYVTDDISKYDFTLDRPAKKTANKPKAIEFRKDPSALEAFAKAKTPFTFPSNFPVPTIPHSFTGKHKIKRSRFEPVSSAPETDKTVAPKTVVHNAETRAEMLKDYRVKQREKQEKAALRNEEARKKNLELLLGSNRFVASSSTEVFKEKTLQTTSEMISSLVSKETAEKSAEGAEQTSPFFSERFVSAAQPDDPTNTLLAVQRTESLHGTEDTRRAAGMKMFGPLTRTVQSWNPAPFLCKKFNVPPPLFDGSAARNTKKRTKLLIFEYQKAKDGETNLKPGLTETALTVAPPETPPKTAPSEKAEPAKETPIPVPDPVVEKKPEEKEAQEQKVIAAETESHEISAEKNMDLFKAVFLSSSEDEDSDNEQDKEQNQKETHMDIITKEISEAILPKIVPKKIGILSNLTFTKPTKSKQATPPETVQTTMKTTQKPETNVPKKPDAADLYGPQLPKEPAASHATMTSGRNLNCAVSADDDEWIERDEIEKSSSSPESNSVAHKHKKKKHKRDHEEKKKKHKSKHKKHKKDKR